MPVGVEYDDSLSKPHMMPPPRQGHITEVEGQEGRLSTTGPRRLSVRTGVWILAKPTKLARGASLVSKSRQCRLLSSIKSAFSTPPPPDPRQTAASSSPVATYSHSSPWPTTRRYVLHDSCMWLYPTFSARRCHLRAGITPPTMRSATTMLISMCSMSTPSRAPMPVLLRPTPCSALL